MTRIDPLAAFPDAFRVTTSDRIASYRRAPDLFAHHGPDEGGDVVFALDDPPIQVLRGVPRRPKAGTLSPVYALEGGGPVVPTGLVLVRFSSGMRAADQDRALRAAGYEIREELTHAPEAAWVAVIEGGIAESLRGLRRLGGVPGVVHVEPQLVRRSARR